MMRALLTAILAVISFTVSAAFDPSQMAGFKPSNPGDVRVEFSKIDNPKTVVENGGFAVVNFGREEKCPSGGFYLINIQRQTYQFIDAGSCDGKLTATLTDPTILGKRTVVTQVLTFYLGNVITARYPLYGY
ncbi:hypothetical protein BIZ83_gp187 [Erwinia phage vB_EamM_ChrisDB]|uniref:hypothetical protein n=1 Tax=Erwinia phage vB_EamM_ChrisDB TaxID=1883371 RepID=UPI00081C38C7|nr:hypothetical protein BIZ83_gp187 [Erwinia phage vB_EamM_ChrisDB]ANZ48666.1 hypothetical protein CHRISDB_104 [Erwinia phage vB_EamM_ChrisDB]